MGDTLLGVVNAFAVVVLAGITYWYARSTSHMLAQMKVQAEATARQAEATQATLELMRRAALPEWDMYPSFSPQEVLLNITNNGESPGRNIRVELVPNPPGEKKAASLSDVPPASRVVRPRDNFRLRLTSEDPPYEGTLVIRSAGRWGAEQVDRWHIRLHRRDYGHHELELIELGRTTECGSTKGLPPGSA
jgi:hypothetical protein